MPKTLMFVGCCNRALPYFATTHGEGIAAFAFDEATGGASPLETTAGIDNPTFLAVSPDGRTLYATSEVLGWNEGVITAYAIDSASGRLEYLNKQPTRGSIVAQVSFDRAGRYLLAVNYGVGPTTQKPNRSLVVFPLSADGELRPAVAEATHSGQGHDPIRQDRPHAHCVIATPDNKYVVVSDLGLDQLVIYRFHDGGIARHSDLALPPGSGPRHFVFHPRLPYAYVGNELNSTVASLAFDPAEGRLALLSIAALVPDSARSGNHCAEIKISDDGRRLYVGNRGHDSLSRLAIDDRTGVATLIGNTPSGGKTPRHFAFDPSGAYLAVANQDSDCVTIFAVDRASGDLKQLPNPARTGTPTCVAFVRLPG
ncbi:MAG TPA: lactonase family protein [Roseiarcus sp.]|nr:lactonase family protein [Roseiarcus sp.]